MARAKHTNWRDPNGQSARIYHRVAQTPAWCALTSSAIRLYVDMRLKLKSFNNGNIEAVFSELKHRGWKSKTTLHKALRELETLGFIVQTRKGGIASMSKICSLYRFTDQPTAENVKLDIRAERATHDYQRFKSVREAKARLRESEAERRATLQSDPKKSKVQCVDLSGPISGPVIVQDDSIGRRRGLCSGQKLDLSAHGNSVSNAL